MGDKADMPPMDYYLTLGKNHGIAIGTKIEVLRRQSSYDVPNRKLHKDLTYPIARLKVIHTENGASIARLETMTSIERRPSLVPNAVAIGDIVRVVQ